MIDSCKKNKLLLKNGTFFEFSYPFKVEKSDILVEDGIISKVGSFDYSDFKGTVLDLTGKYISPGLVCSHNHFYSALARGITVNIGKTPDFISILEQLWWKLDKAIDEEVIYYSSLIGAIDAIKSGTTSVFDHHSSPSFINGSLKLIEKSFLETGLRGILCYEVSDRNGEKGMIEGIEENLTFSSYLTKKNKSQLIESAIGAHASFTLGDRAMSLLSMSIDRTGKGIHIHVAEDKYDVNFSVNNYGRTPVERLYDFGLLTEKSLLAHCTHISSIDLKLIEQKKSFIVHNPKSNMNNKVGYFKQAGSFSKVALGTDGIGSNMLEELKFSYFIAKENKMDFDFKKCNDLLNTGNIILNQYFNKNFGKISEGYTADLTIYDYFSPTPINEKNIAGHLIFGISAKDVESVIINGNLVYQNREFPFKIGDIYSKGQKIATKLWQKMENL